MEEIQLSKKIMSEIQALKNERNFIDSKIVKLASENEKIAKNVFQHKSKKQELEKDLALNIRIRIQKRFPIISENIAFCIDCNKFMKCYNPITASAGRKSSISRAFDRIRCENCQ
jgi:hypothetical protein